MNESICEQAGPDDIVALHAEGRHFWQEVGRLVIQSGELWVNRDADVAAAMALEEGQTGAGQPLVNQSGELWVRDVNIFISFSSVRPSVRSRADFFQFTFSTNAAERYRKQILLHTN